MTVIPYNVPGLPEPEELTSQFVFKPIAIDTSDPHVGPRIAHRPAARGGAPTSWNGDGVMCLYPGIESVAYLFNASLRTRHHEPVPALVVTSPTNDGLCMIFGFAGGYGDVAPQLIVELLPDEFLPAILGRDRDSPVIDVGRIEERVEISQTFTANCFGVVSRAGNDLTSSPKPGAVRRGGEPIFNLYGDTGSIADVCSFYFSRALDHRDLCNTRSGTAAALGGPESVWQLLWKPASFRCVAAFATVFILTRLSVSVRRARGETSFALDFNRRANWSDRGPDSE
jgi:hypothetical protein